MSQSGSLGGAQLITELVTKQFEASLKKLETDTLDSFKRMSVASKDILAKGAFSTGTNEIKTLTAALKPLTNALELVAAAGVKVGDGVGGGAGKAKPPLTDLQKSILALKNETAAYRSVVESTDVSNKDAIANFTRLKTESLALASSLDATSKEYRDLVGVSAQASRSIKTLSDETTRLGLSGNVAVANTRTLTGQLGNLQGAVAPLLGGLGLAGLSTVSGDLATKANAVNVSYDILSLTMDRVGASSSAVQDSISNTAASLGVAEGQVVDYATQLLRMGVAAEEIDDVLIAGGSSALAFGKTAAQGIESVTSALVTQNSQNLNAIGVAENIGAAMGKAAEGAAKYGEEASKQAAAQEGVRIILKATADEVASLDKLTGGLAGSQNEAATAAFELKQRMGEALIPLETLKNDVLSGLLDSFEQLPGTTQASVAGIGGVTVATSALATALTALRPLLAAAFLPPAGMIILGATAAAALGTALFTLAKNAKNTVTPLKTLGENAEITQSAIGNASDKESLAGALEDLSGQLDGKGKKALKNYATEVRNAKGDVDDLKKSASDLVTQITLDQALTTRAEMVAKLKIVPEVEGLDPQGIVDDLEARLNRSPEFQGQGIQLKLGIVEEGGQYAIKVLEGISKNAVLSADSMALLDDSLNETNVRLNTTADAAGTQLRGEIQRLDTYINTLRESLASGAPVLNKTNEELEETGPAADDAADGLTNLGGAAGTAATEAERALQATKDYVFMLSQGVQQGVRPFEGAMHLLTTALERQEGIQRTLAQQGSFGSNYQLAAEKADLLRAAIEELKGIKLPEPIPEAAFTPLDNAAESARQAGKELRILRADVQNHAVETREAAKQNAALDAVLKQLAKDIGQVEYREAANNLDLQGEAARVAADRHQDLRDSVAAGKDEQIQLANNLELTSQQVTAQAEAYSSVQAGLKAAATNYALTGDATQKAADEAAVYQSALDTLVSAGFEPTNALVQEYARKLEEATTKQERIKVSLDTVKGAITDAKTAIAETDFSQLTEGGPEAVQDYLTELSKLITLLRQLEQTNPKMFNSLGGAQALADLENLVSGVEDVAGGMIDAAKAADTLSNALDIFGALTEGALDLAEALGADVEELDTVAKGVLGLGSALQKALSGDIIGAITTAIGTLFDVIVDGIEEANRKLSESGDAVEKYGLEWLKANGYIYYDANAGFVVDTAALAEYEQYLAAIEERGQAVADKYVTIDEQGKVTFNEEAFAEAEQGLDRLADTADRYREKLDEIKDAVDSVNEAELEAKQLTLDAKIEGQDGAYSVDDIFAQQELDIAEAAQKRDAAYHEAFKLEQAGYADLAARRRAAADEAYQAEISMINEGATDRAEAIGANNGEFQSALQQNGAEAEQYYQDYWNNDTNAQIAAQASAREQLRRQQAVMNSQRYTDLLNAGYTEQEAYRLAAEGLGYTIDATTQDLVTQQEQAGVAQGQAATNAGNTAATGITAGWGAAVGAVVSGGSSLNTTLASTQGVASSLIAGLFGNTRAAVATQGGALAGTFSTTYGSIIASVVSGASGLNTTLTNGANLNLGTISSVTNALGGAIVGGGNALAKAELAKANQLIKQKQEGAKKEAGAEISNGNELNKVVTGVSDLKIAQIKAATDAQSTWIGKAFDGLIGQVIAGNKGLADAWSGKGTHWSSSSKPHWSSGTGGMTKLVQDAFKAIGGNFNPDWANPVDPDKYREQQEKKLNGGKGGLGSGSGAGKGGSKGSSGGKGSGSSGNKGTGGKKDGSTYTGGGSKEYPQGSPGWYEARMREIDEQIKKTASQSAIRKLQAQKDKLKTAYDKLMGEGTKSDPKAPAGSINEIEERLSKAREAFENATTDAARTQAAERIKVLEAELKEKRKLLEDSAKDVQDAVKGTVISIESPIADLGTLAYLAEQVGSATARIPTSVAAASSAGAASITRLPESYTPSILPAYQEQMNITTQMGGHIDRFGGHIDRFGSFVTRLERLERGGRSTSELPAKARGQGLSTFTLR